jgi:hypothetical protein
MLIFGERRLRRVLAQYEAHLEAQVNQSGRVLEPHRVLAVMRMSGMDMGPGSDLGSRFGQSLVMPVALGMIGLGLWAALGLL